MLIEEYIFWYFQFCLSIYYCDKCTSTIKLSIFERLCVSLCLIIYYFALTSDSTYGSYLFSFKTSHTFNFFCVYIYCC